MIYKRKTCKFCKRRIKMKENQEFCSDICRHSYRRDILYKKWGRGPSYQYICRVLTTKNKSGDAFGITIPRELVEKYNLLGKKFDIEVKKKGVFVIKTNITYVEK